MYRFSIVVPMLGRSSLFEATLASILRYRTESCQVIVAHDGTYSDPHGLADEIEFVVASQSDQLIQLFNCGLKVAKGEIVALIRPGIELNEGWDKGILEAFSDDQVGSVAPAVVDNDEPARLVTAGVSANFKFSRRMVGARKKLNSRRIGKTSPLAPTSWAAFYRRSLLNSLGSCDEQLDPHYLDVDLGLSLKNLDFACVFQPECVVTIDDAMLIKNELRLPHGKSAQRSLLRQRILTGSQMLARTALATITDLVTAPFSPANLRHAIQRFGAIRMRSFDRHHWSLLELLNRQRQRLITTGIQSHQAAIGSDRTDGKANRIRRAA